MQTCVFFRVDASRQIGGGHLSRCLALADSIAGRGSGVHFLCAPLERSYLDQITARGHRLTATDTGDFASVRQAISSASESIRLLVVDHYGIDARWESRLRPMVDRIAVIDDLANRTHDCDLLVDQTYGENGSRYVGLVPEACAGLFGTRFALLRPEFAEIRARRTNRHLRSNCLTVHVFLGSEDHTGNTLRFTKLLMDESLLGEVRVAVSPNFSDTEALDALRRRSDGRMNWQVVGPRMAEHMAGCDIAIGAPGHSTWERACLGLPALYVAISDNQVPILAKLTADGLCRSLGRDRDLADADFRSAVRAFASDRKALAAMRELALAAVDGLGSARVADRVLALAS